MRRLVILAAILCVPALALAQSEGEDPISLPELPAPEEPAPDEPAPAEPAPAPEGAQPPPPPDEADAEAAADEEPGEEEEEEEEDEEHHGFFFRFALGLGYGFINGDGTMPPAKGLELVEDPTHHSPVFNLALSLGGGFLDLALHAGLWMERMILRSDEPIEMGLTLWGIGGGASYYFTDNDFFVTAQLRFVGLMLFMPGVICESGSYHEDKFEWYRGPGVSLTIGKEWYGDNDRGIGLGLQGNYVYLMHDSEFAFHYGSVLIVLTLTKF